MTDMSSILTSIVIGPSHYKWNPQWNSVLPVEREENSSASLVKLTEVSEPEER